MALPLSLVQPQDPSYPPDHEHDQGPDPAPPAPIFEPLPETDIGVVYRGDTILLPIWIAENWYDGENKGAIIDLTGATVWFTCKVDLAAEDGEPTTIQRTTANGGVIIESATQGAYRVWIDPGSTYLLDDDTIYQFDVQVKTGETVPTTVSVKRGIMKVVRDVTRSIA